MTGRARRRRPGSGLRVVVVGATGNIGTSVLDALGRDPAVASIVGAARRLPDLVKPKTDWAVADVATNDLVPLVAGADVVVHLAWVFQPTRDPLATWRVNVLGTVRLLRAVAEAGVPALVCASSVGAYSPGPADGRPVDESWPTHGWPTAAYLREKAYVERLLDGYEAAHPDRRVVRLRPAFVFKRESAAEQRRLFAGPLLPGRLVRPGLVPAVPHIPGLRFQAVHSDDVAEAVRLAAGRPVHGAFNLAADPVIDTATLARLLGARTVRVPAGLARAVLAAAWHARLVPASPYLFDGLLSLPVMDSSRARTELGWEPRHTGVAALEGMLRGLREGAGLPTPPLAAGRLAAARAQRRSRTAQKWPTGPSPRPSG